MKSIGSCIALYPLHLTDDVLEAIKELKKLDYSDRQLSVIGEWSLSDEVQANESRSDEYPTFNEFRNQGLREVFWDELGDLLEGKVSLQIPESGSLTVAGGLSNKVLHEKETVVKIQDDPEHKAEWNRLFHSLGIPKASFKYYETTLKTGLLILVAFGSHKEVEEASNLLELSRSIEVSLHLRGL